MNNVVTKKQFTNRMIAVYIAIVAWGISGPVLKTYFNLLPPVAFSVLGLWVMVVSLSQKYLRRKFNIVALMKMLMFVDLIYLTVIGFLNYTHNIRDLIVFDFILDGFYGALIIATTDKIQSFYIGKFKPGAQDRIRATITNNKQYASIIALVLAGILGMLYDVYTIIWIKLITLFVVVYFEYKSIK